MALTAKVGEIASPIAWSPDSTQLAISGGGEGNQQVIILDAASGEMIMKLETSGWIESLAWSHSGRRLATAGGGWAEVWEIPSGRQIFKISGEGVHSWGIQQVALSPDGSILATAAGEVVLWEIDPGKQISILIGLNDGVSSMAFNSEGTRLAARSDDGVVMIWELNK